MFRVNLNEKFPLFCLHHKKRRFTCEEYKQKLIYSCLYKVTFELHCKKLIIATAGIE